LTFPPTIGVVLGGGLARRMGGGDKGHIRIGTATMLERIVERLSPQCAGIVFNTNNSDPTRSTNVPVVGDSVPGRPGPLAGILAGLDWTAANAPDAAWIVSVPNDSPFLPRDLIARLHQARAAAGAVLAAARSAHRNHPVVALWPVALREDLRRAVTVENLRRVSELAARYPLATAEWPADPIDPFFNINTPRDAAEAERMAAQFPDA
jgi:molybdenum cofactor guanylyltransferase